MAERIKGRVKIKDYQVIRLGYNVLSEGEVSDMRQALNLDKTVMYMRSIVINPETFVVETIDKEGEKEYFWVCTNTREFQ